MNYLSCLKLREPVETKYDELLDANLFSLGTGTLLVDIEDEWIMEMMQFFSIGLPPEHLTLDAKK